MVEDAPIQAPARILADLYRRCGEGGGCPYDPGTLLGVLAELREDRAVSAGALGEALGLSAASVYGCLLELEDHGLARVIYREPEPDPCSGGPLGRVSARITGEGMSLLGTLRHEGRRP